MAETPASEALDTFGRLLGTRVRDEAITDWGKILDGTMKGSRAQEIRQVLAPFSKEELEVIKLLVPKIVDTTLHHLLWTLEQEGPVCIASETSGGVVPSLREVSDGLAGELPGWIAKYSDYPGDEG